MKKQAFTLVELIVVITILAILGTIAFISLSGYSKEARDSKRITDTSSILSKINIEFVKGEKLSNLIIKDKDNNLTIKSSSNPGFQGIPNYEVLKEDYKNFRDPTNNQIYPFAYTIGGTGSGAYTFMQMATVSESEGRARLIGNYFKFDDNDSPSLFTSSGTTGTNIPADYLEDNGIDLPYDIGIKNNTTPVNIINGECGSANLGSYTNTPSENLCLKGTSSVVNSINNGFEWSCVGNNGGTTVNCNANYEAKEGISQSIIFADTTYPGCDTRDIIIGDYVISACNVGATQAGTYTGCVTPDGSSYSTNPECDTKKVGQFFQWGNNYGFPSSEALTKIATSKVSVTPSNENSNYSSDTFIKLSSDWFLASSGANVYNLWGGVTNTNISKKGPCADGYRLPTSQDWNNIVVSGGWGQDGNKIRDDLLLPMAGYRNRYLSTIHFQGSIGYYITANLTTDSSYPGLYLGIVNTIKDGSITPSAISHTPHGKSARCIRN